MRYNYFISAQPCVCLPYIVMADTLEFSGTAVIDDYVMVKHYPLEYSNCYKLLIDRGNNIYFKLPEGDLHIDSASMKLTNDGGENFSYRLNLTCRLDSYADADDDRNGRLDAIETRAEKYLQTLSYEYIESLKNEARGDALGIGRYLRRHRNAYYLSLDKSDYEIFADSRITVEYHVHILRNGIIY